MEMVTKILTVVTRITTAIIGTLEDFKGKPFNGDGNVSNMIAVIKFGNFRGKH